MSRIFVILVLLSSVAALAEDPTLPPQQQAPQPKPVALGHKGTFYLAMMSPIPATFGLGITHYFNPFVGFALELGKGEGVVYMGGVKLRPYAGKLSPILGLNGSLGEESLGAPRAYYYFNTGLDWKWDMGMFLHFGINWTLTKKDGSTEMKPYLQIGIHY